MSESNEKIVIAEVADNRVHYEFFPYAANTWIVQTNNDYSSISDPDFELGNIGLVNSDIVLSFQVGKRNYRRVETEAAVISEQGTFYFSFETKTLLVHFENHKPYYYFDTQGIEIGYAICFFNTNAECGGVWNDIQYSPRLISSSTLKDTIDDIINSKQVYQSASIEIDNYDLRYWMDASKAKTELNWESEHSLNETIKLTVDWYLKNQEWLNKANDKII